MKRSEAASAGLGRVPNRAPVAWAKPVTTGSFDVPPPAGAAPVSESPVISSSIIAVRSRAAPEVARSCRIWASQSSIASPPA